MTVTKQMMQEALSTAHEECERRYCVHEEAIAKLTDPISKDVAETIMAILNDRDEEAQYVAFIASIFRREFALVLTIWDCGFHVGYKLKELENKKEEVAELGRLFKKTGPKPRSRKS